MTRPVMPAVLMIIALASTSMANDLWVDKTSTIEQSFERDRERWFAFVVANLEGHKHEHLGNRTPMRRQLSGDAISATKAMQMLLAATVMNEREYVARADGQDFMTVLLGQVAGRSSDVDRFFKRYTENLDYRGQGLFRFGMDIAFHIHDEGQSTPAPMFIAKDTILLKHLVEATIANAFNDRVTANAARARANEYSQSK